jgi:CRISPR-associated protein Csx16
MTIFFVSRHPGAIDWVHRHGISIDRILTHLDPEEIQAGDMVIGMLPIHLAAEVCARKARYLHLSVDLPQDRRGVELSADELEHFGARIEEYLVGRSNR